MTLVPIGLAAQAAAELVGPPVIVDLLKDKPGRRRTMRARGPNGTVIVKTYASDRAATVAARIAALAGGPPQPVVPRLLHVDVDQRLVILTDVPGTPLRVAVLGGDFDACRAAGAALGTWHRAWAGREPPPLRPHTVDRELAILDDRGAHLVEPGLGQPWPCTTVVHRDLYEEQVLTGPAVGLIDLDDAHLGPPELDLGNLLAHLVLLDIRSASATGAAAAAAILDAYTAAHGAINETRLKQCEHLSRLRLEQIHATRIGASIRRRSVGETDPTPREPTTPGC